MPALLVVEFPERGDAAPAEGEVGVVGVFEAYRRGPEIKSGRRPDAVREGAFCGLVVRQKGFKSGRVKLVKLGGPGGECPCVGKFGMAQRVSG